MSANKLAFARYRIIDKCLRNKDKPFPSKQYIMNKIAEALGYTIGLRTIEADFDDMRNEPLLAFYAPIEYDQRKGGYHYTDPEYSIWKSQEKEWL